MDSTKLFLIVFVLFFQKNISSQSFEWAHALGSNEIDHINAHTTDQNGNIYITGSFKGTVDFDPGNGTNNLTAVGESDVFIQKLDPSGNLLWVKSIGGSNFDSGLDLTTDVNGNVFTTGTFKGTVDFDPGNGVQNLTSNGQYDVFIQKLNSAGNLEWAKSFGGSNFDYGRSIEVDPFSNIYITGSYRNTVDFDPGNGTYNLTSAGGEDIYVLKLNFLGNFVYAKSMGGTENDVSTDLEIDNLGFVYLTGNFNGTADFDPGNGVQNLTSNGGTDLFIQKLNLSGNTVFTHGIGGIENDGGTSIHIDGNNNIYTTGFFSSTVDFNINASNFNLTSAGYEDVFVLKLNNLGNFSWAKSIGSPDFNSGNSIYTDSDNNVYITGFYRGSVDLDPGAGLNNVFSNGFQEIFLIKLDEYGNFKVGFSLGGTGDDYGASISLDLNNNIILSGDFQETIDFNPGSINNELTSNGNFDGYILKYGPSSCLPNATSPIYLELNLDENCAETSWDIKSQSGLTLHSGGPYNCDPNGGGVQSNTTIQDTLYLLLFECYSFNIYDANGDGLSNGNNGSWELKDQNGLIISSGIGNFGFQDSSEFYINSEITSNSSLIDKKQSVKIFPNPTNNKATIEILNSQSLIVDISIFDLRGNLIFMDKDIRSSSYLIKNTAWSKGTYIVKIKMNDEIIHELIVIN